MEAAQKAFLKWYIQGIGLPKTQKISPQWVY